MAANLAAKDFAVTGYDIVSVNLDRAATQGITAAKSAEDAVKDAEIVDVVAQLVSPVRRKAQRPGTRRLSEVEHVAPVARRWPRRSMAPRPRNGLSSCDASSARTAAPLTGRPATGSCKRISPRPCA